MQKWLVAVVLASGCATVWHTRVYTDFELVRFRVVTDTMAASAGKVGVALPGITLLAGQPSALVLRLANTSEAPRVVRVAAGGAVLGEATVPPRREALVRLSVPDGAVLNDASDVELTAAGDDWALTYLEAANVHGFSRGLFDFRITPAAVPTPQPLGARASVPAFALLLALYVAGWSWLAHPRRHRAHTTAAALVALFLLAVLAAPFVSPFGVHLAAHTLLICLAVLHLPALAIVARQALPPAASMLGHALRAVGVPVDRVVVPGLRSGSDYVTRVARWLWAARISIVYSAAIMFFVISIAKQFKPDTGLTTLIGFGDRFEDRTLPSVRAVPRQVHEDSIGYDGQFYAQLAVDPLLRDPAIAAALDAPAYRARRILFSWTAYLAGLGRPGWIVHAYVVQYVVTWLVLAWVLCRWFPPTSIRHLGSWFACLFSGGLILSVLTTMPDGPGMLLLAVGAAAMELGRTNRAAAVLGIACLAKSTNILWSAMVVGPSDVRRRDWRSLLLRALLVAGPAVAWTSYLLLGSHELADFPELAGGESGRRNFGLPFSGYAAKWSTTVAQLRIEGWHSRAYFSLLVLIGLTTQAVVLLAVRDWRNPWWRAGIGSVVLMAFLGPAVWEGHPGAATRVLLPMAFAFNLVLPRIAWFWPLFVLGNLAVLYSLEALRVSPF